jgi:hypothetical protein
MLPRSKVKQRMLPLNMSAARFKPTGERRCDIPELTGLNRALTDPSLARQTARGEFINMSLSLPQSDFG